MRNGLQRRVLFSLVVGTTVLLAAHPLPAALQPDQIALVANANIPESVELAEHYAKERGIPDGRIIVLKLPISEEMPFDLYERAVVPPIREFLRKNQLDKQVTCLVTFYGVPFRIGPHLNTANEVAESAKLREELDRVRRQLSPVVGTAEQLASELDHTYKSPTTSTELEQMAVRTDAAFRAVQQALAGGTDVILRNDVTQQLFRLTEQLAGPYAILEKLTVGQLGEAQLDRRTVAEWAELQANGPAIRQRTAELFDLRYDANARAELREIVKDTQGLFGYGRLLVQQIQYFESDYTVAALDSELNLLWWNYYPRARWMVNPMHHEARAINAPPPMMVMRLDGPTPNTVKDIIAASIKAENEGLRGEVVLDSRGIQPKDAKGQPVPYGVYDQTIRDLATLIRTKTKLSLIVDDGPTVFPAGSAADVAIYCGWYSLRNYVPAFAFTPGAVGYHIASLEMVSLRTPTEKGWVRGLLNDGIAATMGAVAEPYLHSFPLADEYFALLFTGKLTLAEVYWRTAPTTSWMISVIGDPLYTPYKENPALAVEDVPAQLQVVFKPSTGSPGRSSDPDAQE